MEDDLLARFEAVRGQTAHICEPLALEDYGVQPMEDASPPKWHLAHTSWFFETFVLKPFMPAFMPFHRQFEYLFNSYYNGVGNPFPRARRGALSRPTVAEVFDYRAWVNEGVARLLSTLTGPAALDVAERVELGIHHEQQHQELILTDLKFNLGNNPLHPAYRTDLPAGTSARQVPGAVEFETFHGGMVEVGASGPFCFDNELPRHQVWLSPYALGRRLVTNGEYAEFVRAGGYTDSELWLSDGWSWLCTEAVHTPLYWRPREAGYDEYRLSGLEPLDPHAPVAHVSFYEADAYARWSGCRLPTEHEWEHAAAAQPCEGNFITDDRLHPSPASGRQSPLDQLYGDLWEWTASPYVAYPRYRPLPGTLGEYNGKFMSNQLVLRGGSCVTPAGHMRPSYRNFFYPRDRWQFTGIRLARDV